MTPSRRGARRRRIGVVDIGTNSTKLILGEVHGDRVVTLFFDRRTSRLGERLSRTGRISDTAAARTARDVRSLASMARSRGADAVVAVGTYAFRAAKNGDAVARRITRHAGVPIRVLTGHEEATLSYLSVLMRLRRPKPYTFLIDLGGGSVEFVVAHRGRILRARSLPLGALRLTERHLHSDPITRAQRVIMEREIDVAVSRVIAPFRRVQPTKIDFVASGGTATTAFAMLATHRTSRVSVARVTRAGLEKLADDCFARTLAQRKRLPGLPADRADIIPAGLAVVLAFMQHARKRTLAVSDGGVREGVLLAIDAELEAIAHDRAHQH